MTAASGASNPSARITRTASPRASETVRCTFLESQDYTLALPAPPAPPALPALLGGLAGGPRVQRGAVHGRSAQIHGRDAARVRDVVERVGVEDDEVRALARLHRSSILQQEQFGAIARRGHEDLRR